MTELRTKRKDVLRGGVAETIKRIKSFATNCRGGSMILFGLSLPVLIGMAGLGYDATIWYMTKRQIQTVADNAVLTGVYTLEANPGGSLTGIQTAVEGDATRNDFDWGNDGKTITAFNPPSSGPNSANNDAVEVIVTQPGELYFSSIILPNEVTVAARAVAALTPTGGEHCLLALDPVLPRALEFTGTADAQISCGIASNSVDDQSIYVGGNADLTADPAQAVGGIYEGGSATFNTTHHPQPYSTPMPDPYAGIAWPEDVTDVAAMPCNAPPADPDVTIQGQKIQISGVVETDFPAGKWCNEFQFQNGADITLAPGVHIFWDGDDLDITNGHLRGTGVTMVFTADPGTDSGTFHINGGSVILSAPGPDGVNGGTFDGLYAGMLMLQNPLTEKNGGGMEINQLNGNTDLDLQGAIYAPNSGVTFNGGASNGDGCIQIVARKITISGTSNILNDPDDCANAGVDSITARQVQVLE